MSNTVIEPAHDTPDTITDLTPPTPGPQFATTSFADAIRETARQMDRAPADAQVSALESVIRQVATVTVGGGLGITTEAGVIGVRDYIAMALRNLPPVSVPDPASVVATTADAPIWSHGRTGTIADMSRGFAAAQANAALREAVAGPNPWASGYLNRTRQQVISNLNPALAAELKIKAGVA